MEYQEPTPGESPNSPEALLLEFRNRNENLDARLDSLLKLVGEIRTELNTESQAGLARLARAAADMTNGRVYQQIDIQAKGELGALVTSLNKTLQNLQQLDASVKSQSTQVPELAAQLDTITADTEEATQSVMNRLDTLMASADEAGRAVQLATSALQEEQESQAAFHAQLDTFLERASAGEAPTVLAQEILDYLFAQRMAARTAPVDLSGAQAGLKTISDEAFEILNTLQFQDITRQKVDKVVLLLKQFKDGLSRLLSIFKIEGESAETEPAVFEERAVATQERIFETTLEADQKKESVEDIIAQFKRAQA